MYENNRSTCVNVFKSIAAERLKINDYKNVKIQYQEEKQIRPKKHYGGMGKYTEKLYNKENRPCYLAEISIDLIWEQK